MNIPYRHISLPDTQRKPRIFRCLRALVPLLLLAGAMGCSPSSGQGTELQPPNRPFTQATAKPDWKDEVFARRIFLQDLETTRGREHPETLLILSRLANLLADNGDTAAAEPLFRRLLEVQERTLGLTHYRTLNSAVQLTKLLTIRHDMAPQNPKMLTIESVREPTLIERLNELDFMMLTGTGAECALRIYMRLSLLEPRLPGADRKEYQRFLLNQQKLGEQMFKGS